MSGSVFIIYYILRHSIPVIKEKYFKFSIFIQNKKRKVFKLFNQALTFNLLKYFKFLNYFTKKKK